MESRHDSENAERILYNMRPKELVSRMTEPLAVARSSSRASWVPGQSIYFLELSSWCQQSEAQREHLIRATGQGREVTPVWSRGPLPSAQPPGRASPGCSPRGRQHQEGRGGLEFIRSSALPWVTLVPLWAPLPWKEEDGVSWSRGLLGSLSRWFPQGPVCNAHP